MLSDRQPHRLLLHLSIQRVLLLLVLVCEVDGGVRAVQVVGHATQSDIASPVEHQPGAGSNDQQIDTEVKLASFQQQGIGDVPAAGEGLPWLP